MTSDRPLLLITAAFDPRRIIELEQHFEVVSIEPSLAGDSLSTRGINDYLARATALITEIDMVDEASLKIASHLKVVVSCRANPVNVDLDACTARGIPVLTTPARNAEVTADFAFTLLLMTVRKAGQAERWLRDGNWSDDDVFEPYSLFRGIQLSGRTLGILGGGAVGRRVLQRARGFGMDVLVYDPFLKPDAFGEEARVVSLTEVLAESDIVTMHVPLMESTIGLIGKTELALMKPGSYFINAARAALVDEDALVEAASNGHLAGVGLDVFWTEPVDRAHPLLGLDNVTVSPHIGGASDDVISEHSRIAVAGLNAWLVGDELINVKNTEVLASSDNRS